MPSDEDVTQRAGSLGSMTSVTEAERPARMTHVPQALMRELPDRTIDGQSGSSRLSRPYDPGAFPTTADKRFAFVR
jgi:hypothetical protein